MKNGVTIYEQATINCNVLMDKLREEKKKQGKTYQELSDDTGIPIQTISRCLSGAVSNPGIYTIAALCAALGVDLLTFSGGGPSEEEDSSEMDMLQMEIDHKDEMLHEKDRAISRLEGRTKTYEHEIDSVRSDWRRIAFWAFGLVFLLTTFLMVYVVLDISNPDMGLFRATGANPVVYLITIPIVWLCLYGAHRIAKKKGEKKRANNPD